MSNGLMATDNDYPNSTGLQLDGVPMLAGYDFNRHLAALSVEGVPGTGASYKLQVNIADANVGDPNWVDVSDSTLSGDGAAATGQMVVPVIGKAIKVVAVNGSGAGTGANTPSFVLNVYKDTRQNLRDFSSH